MNQCGQIIMLFRPLGCARMFITQAILLQSLVSFGSFGHCWPIEFQSDLTCCSSWSQVCGLWCGSTSWPHPSPKW